MGKYAMRRTLLFIPTLLLATVMVFALFWIVPGLNEVNTAAPNRP